MEKPDSPVAGIEILFQCMKDIADNLVEHLSHKEYQWSADRGEKIFECLVLSKFFLDHALLTTYASKIDEGRIKLRLQMINSVFKTMLGSTLSGDKFKTERLIHIDDLASRNPLTVGEARGNV